MPGSVVPLAMFYIFLKHLSIFNLFFLNFHLYLFRIGQQSFKSGCLERFISRNSQVARSDKYPLLSKVQIQLWICQQIQLWICHAGVLSFRNMNPCLIHLIYDIIVMIGFYHQKTAPILFSVFQNQENKFMQNFL